MYGSDHHKTIEQLILRVGTKEECLRLGFLIGDDNATMHLSHAGLGGTSSKWSPTTLPSLRMFVRLDIGRAILSQKKSCNRTMREAVTFLYNRRSITPQSR